MRFDDVVAFCKEYRHTIGLGAATLLVSVILGGSIASAQAVAIDGAMAYAADYEVSEDSVSAEDVVELCEEQTIVEDVVVFSAASGAVDVHDVEAPLAAEPVEEVVESVEAKPIFDANWYDMMACVVQAEAGNQEFVGQVAVAWTVVCRGDANPDNYVAVMTSPGQYAMASSASAECYEAVDYALEHGGELFPDDMKYFRTKYYHDFGTPYMQIGDHYFSCD